MCLRNNIRPIFMTLTPLNPENIDYVFHTPTDPAWFEKMQAVNKFIRGLPYFIDVAPYFIDEEKKVMADDMSIDGIHPDLRGKILMGEIINRHRYLFRNSER